MLKPLHQIIMVEPIDVATNTTLIVPDSVKENIQFRYGWVRAIGEGVESHLTVGDKILYVHGQVFDYAEGEKKYILISEDSLVGIITDGAELITVDPALN